MVAVLRTGARLTHEQDLTTTTAGDISAVRNNLIGRSQSSQLTIRIPDGSATTNLRVLLTSLSVSSASVQHAHFTRHTRTSTFFVDFHATTTAGKYHLLIRSYRSGDAFSPVFCAVSVAAARHVFPSSVSPDRLRNYTPTCCGRPCTVLG